MDKIVFLIRHGETTGDVEDRYGGDYDDDLTEKGIGQCQVLAQELSGKGIEAVLTSPLKRAQQAARILGEAVKLTPVVVPGLKERNAYGVVTGLTKDEAKAKFPDVVAGLAPTATVEGAEPYDQFIERIRETLAVLAERPETTIAAVTHGGFMRGLCRSLLHVGELKDVGDCSYLTLAYRATDNTWHPKGMTGISHGLDLADNTFKRAKVIIWRPVAAGIEFMITREPSVTEWSLPGGHKDEADPSLAVTARRELFEELALEVSDADIVETGITYDYVAKNPYSWKNGHDTHLGIFTVRYADQKITPKDEVAEYRWITANQIDSYPLEVELPDLIRQATSDLHT